MYVFARHCKVHWVGLASETFDFITYFIDMGMVSMRVFRLNLHVRCPLYSVVGGASLRAFPMWGMEWRRTLILYCIVSGVCLTLHAEPSSLLTFLNNWYYMYFCWAFEPFDLIYIFGRYYMQSLRAFWINLYIR